MPPVLRLLTLLALLLSGLALPTFVPGATAKEPPCVVTVANETDKAIPEKPLLGTSAITQPLTVSEAGIIKDVNVSLDIAHGSDGDLRVFVLHGDPVVGVGVVNAAHPGVNFTGTRFDDEAAVALSAGVPPYTGSFRPDAPLSAFDTLAAGGVWTLQVVDMTRNQTAGTLLGWSVTIRYADCDFDGDGLKDEVDNCPDDANASQVDTDGDLLGDACDPDDDNDSIPDTGDNCRTVVNSNQANTDGDLVGNVCDADDDNDGVSDANDACDLMAASTVTGCPRASRTVTISYSAGAFHGKLKSGVQRCYAYRKVQIRRADAGPDTLLATRLTDITGSYSWARARKPGTYYARAARTAIPNVAECAGVESTRIRLS
jgi:subtilisin-like proprotein convertase family protein